MIDQAVLSAARTTYVGPCKCWQTPPRRSILAPAPFRLSFREQPMPLTSTLFSKNAKLQACALEHPAHITTGAVGEHVAKIQFALTTLDRL